MIEIHGKHYLILSIELRHESWERSEPIKSCMSSLVADYGLTEPQLAAIWDRMKEVAIAKIEAATAENEPRDFRAPVVLCNSQCKQRRQRECIHYQEHPTHVCGHGRVAFGVLICAYSAGSEAGNG
jgi:hypothetical protein